MTLLLSSRPKSWILIELDHLLDDLVLGAIQMRVVFELSRIVSTLFSGPLLLIVLEVTLKLTIVLANNSLRWVVKAISNIVGAFWYIFRTIYIVAYQGFSVWPQPLELLCVETAILYGAVVPFFVLELQVIVKEVFSFD